MRHHDDASHAGDDAERDLTQEFWGGASGWDDRSPTRSADSRAQRRVDDTTGAVRAIRDGFVAFRPRTSSHATGEIRRLRHHGAGDHRAVANERAAATVVSDAWDVDPADLSVDHADWSDAPVSDQGEWEWNDDDLVPLGPPSLAERVGLGAVDPLLLRIGLLVTAFVLLVPLALALRSDDAGTVTTGSGDVPSAVAVTTVVPSPSPSTTVAAPDGDDPVRQEPTPSVAPAEPTQQVDVSDSSIEPAVAAGDQTTGVTPAEPEDADTADKTESGFESTESRTSGLDDEPAVVDALADRIEPDCSRSYMARAGDSWYSVADAADVTPTELISENRASLQTIIVPGDEICLPAGASMPSPERSNADAAADTDTDESEAPPTTDPPTTTVAPTTVAPTTVPPASGDEVQQIIRDVWPDDLEEKALEVAFRESRYNARAYNGWCCYGVFQLYWSVHQSWLDDHGINSIEDLYDARKNTEAAYALYRASGGWGPWGG